uniref:Uncharacterized protein n=1 Tax=Anguilla anguilla TaxID=7936 RepID=A0A0E9V7F4_ANGAN
MSLTGSSVSMFCSQDPAVTGVQLF